MSHPYDKLANCQCARCVKERARRAAQSKLDSRWRLNAARAIQPPGAAGRAHRRNAIKVATREEQHARYIDCGPQNWDDRD